jgi:hypothetical protein
MDISRFTQSSDDVPIVAVFLERTSAGNLHTGIIYRDGNRVAHRLHFGWHKNLIYSEKCRKDIGCAIPQLDALELSHEQFIAGFCKRIRDSTANKKIPYNLKLDPDVKFDPITGDIQVGPEFTGLSCATFVVAVFRSSGNPIVDHSSWPPANAEDIAAQTGYVHSLESDPQTARQAAVVKSEIGGPRMRPEHVAGACLEDLPPPAKYQECDAAGLAIIKIVDGT